MSSFYLNSFVFATLLCWGIWGILDKKALLSTNHLAVLFRLYLFSLIEIPIVFVLLNYQYPGWHIDSVVWLYAFFGALLQLIGIAAYLAAMSLAEASFVLGITAGYPLITQFLAVAFLGEEFIVGRFLGAALVGIGVAAIGSSTNSTQFPQEGRKKLLIALLIVIATISWGIFGLVDKKAVMLSGPMHVFFAERVWEMLSLIFIFVFCKMRSINLDLTSKPAWLFSSLSAISLAIGRYAYLSALSLASASYVITVTGCYPLLMYLFALLFLNEKFHRIRFGGIICVIIGGILVQITQNS